MTSRTDRKLSAECLFGVDVLRRVSRCDSSASFPEAMIDMVITAMRVTSSTQSSGETSVLRGKINGERLMVQLC